MIPAAHANDLDGNDNYTFYSEMSINRTYITFNLQDERFQDQRVREAFALAIDNQGCWDRTAGGNGEPSKYMISHAFTKYLDEDSKLPERNVEQLSLIHIFIGDGLNRVLSPKMDANN